MSVNHSNRERWQDVIVLNVYQEGRARTGGLVETQWAEAVFPYIKPDGLVVELGAGDGALIKALYDKLPAGVSWLETDQTAEYLDRPRGVPTEREVMELPEIDRLDESVDTIVSLAAFDTLDPAVLTASMQEVARTLKPGGHFVHLLDLAPNTDYLARQARAEGFMTMPCTLYDDNGELCGSGLSYIDRAELATALDSLAEQDSIKAVLKEFLRDYDKAFAMVGLNFPHMFDFLASILRREGLVRKQINSWENFSLDILTAAKQAGLEVGQNHIAETEADIPSRDLPYDGPDGTVMLERRFGVNSRKFREDAGAPEMPPGVIRVKSNTLVHVLRK